MMKANAVQKAMTRIIRGYFKSKHLTPASFRRYFITVTSDYKLHKQGQTPDEFQDDVVEYLNTSKWMLKNHYDRGSHLEEMAKTQAVVQDNTFLCSKDSKAITQLATEALQQSLQIQCREDENEEENEQDIQYRVDASRLLLQANMKPSNVSKLEAEVVSLRKQNELLVAQLGMFTQPQEITPQVAEQVKLTIQHNAFRPTVDLEYIRDSKRLCIAMLDQIQHSLKELLP
jgi:hypothetical protein